MYVVLDVWTPGVVSLLEAWITLLSMGLFVFTAYLQDRNWFRKKPEPDALPANANEVIVDFITEHRQPSFQSENEDSNTVRRHRIHELVNMHADDDNLAEASVKTRLNRMFSLVRNEVGGEALDVKQKSSMWWKINFRRRLAGRKHVATKEEIQHAREHMNPGRRDLGPHEMVDLSGKSITGSYNGMSFTSPLGRYSHEGGDLCDVLSSKHSVSDIHSLPSPSVTGALEDLNETCSDSNGSAVLQTKAGSNEARVSFTSHEFRCLEGDGKVSIAIWRFGHEDVLNIPSKVHYSTHDGTAFAPEDYLTTKVPSLPSTTFFARPSSHTLYPKFWPLRQAGRCGSSMQGAAWWP
mmetsp:Transcript_35296/g.99925  ORF Transcript_35296/g.99925 Transcript_35296/m.99925 type:complete len:351 (-) Transcript_35296:2116-3168(-)